MTKKSKIILLVEDDKMLRRMYEEKFTIAGFTLETVEDGRLAMEAVKEKKPDLILLDVQMPNMDGFQVLRQLRGKKEYAKMPIIMLTNNSEPEIIRMCKMMGADDYFVKAELTPTQVVEKVHDYLKE